MEHEDDIQPLSLPNDPPIDSGMYVQQTDGGVGGSGGIIPAARQGASIGPQDAHGFLHDLDTGKIQSHRARNASETPVTVLDHGDHITLYVAAEAAAGQPYQVGRVVYSGAGTPNESTAGGARLEHLKAAPSTLAGSPPEVLAIDEWATGTAYAVGDMVENDGSYYECAAAHTSSASDEPPDAEYWYARTLLENVRVIGPAGRHHGYRVGDPIVVFTADSNYFALPARTAFHGVIESNGPGSESDFSDERYWVREQDATVAYSTNSYTYTIADRTRTDDSGSSGIPGRWVQVYNLAEAEGGTHNLPTDGSREVTVTMHNDPDSGEPYYLIDATPTVEVTVMTDFRWDTSSHKFQKKTRTLLVADDGTESGWTDVQDATECDDT